ncbi:hypothetical protein [Paenibacillus oleatilyticus]|uniref:hypothetical protein n=1 Tax=Paenibacillus oleatilyticus TaxID=2594886 RepID=UPI001C1F5290|nr:hypothetical protein [Paenibacillus oleatilyticus]MBU7314059.1 hypothetical protein [Paenibacillus oleatilyticus]
MHKPLRELDLQLFGIGFTAGDDEPVKDALSDDPRMKQILEATTAIALLAIKKQLANEPLSEIDRRIYYEAIEAKCRTEYGYYEVEYAAKQEEEAAKSPVGFQVNNPTVTISTDSIEPSVAVITDSAGNALDVCLAKAVAITDAGGKASGWYKQIVSRVDAINGNNRIYPRTVYQTALNTLKQAGFPYAGEHPHPPTMKGLDGRVLFDSKLPNQAVKFRDAYIDQNGAVWAEYKPLETDMGRQVQVMLDAKLPIGFSNRMTGTMLPATVESRKVNVAKSLNLYTWDVVMNPAETDAFTTPLPLTDSAVTEILDSIQKGDDPKMNFLSMTLEQLRTWKAGNPGHAEMAMCDAAISVKENEQALQDKLEALEREKEERQRAEEAAQKKQAAQAALTDAVNALPYDNNVKAAILKKGEAITDSTAVESFIEGEKTIVDAFAVGTKLAGLGVKNQGGGQATVIDNSIEITGNPEPWKPIVDNLQTAMDDQIRSRDTNFRVDPKLREANKAIIDRLMKKMERESNPEYTKFMKELTDSAQTIKDGIITDSAATQTGDLAQLPTISMAFMYQVWQDLRFLQLVAAEAFSGTTFKIPVEFQSSDLYTQDDFVLGEFDGIPTEGVETYLLEFGAEWLKRGTLISKEAQIELQKGPFNYDVVARNLANLAARFNRVIDQRLSLEMLHVSDEYEAKVVPSENVAAAEMTAATSGGNVPSTSNAAWIVSLLTSYTTGAIGKQVPPIVRPRKKVWLDTTGRKQSATVNDFIAKKGTTTLTRGTWDPVLGRINNGDYAVDWENAKVYFAASAGVDNSTNRPSISYSYAKNVNFFDLTIPDSLKDNPARYYNRLLERIDYQKAYMGAAPRYVTPDFAIGSLNAMVNFKTAELFYKWASPEGTSFLKGEMWFATRAGLNLGEINAPWAAGDQRILIGKTGATRYGVGSPLQMEGPEPYFDKNSMQITSAKQYYATQQSVIATPLVIDSTGKQYNPPYRTIKFFNS